MISFACPSCGKLLKVKDELAGKKGKCPTCGKPLTVPATSENLAAALSEPGKVSPVPSSGASNEDARTLPPKPPAAPRSDAEPPTVPPSGPPGLAAPGDSSGQVTVSAAQPPAEHPPELTAFLAPAQSPDEIGRLGPYRVLSVLGYGGMGVVFRAEDPGLERQVALKAMLPALASNPANRARFLREAKVAAAVKDDHVVAIHQISDERGVPFVAMEFLEGEPLDARLKRGPKLTIPDILRIGRETALGLAAAHKRGLVHRDIKPGNLWLEGERGRVKILDFGLARAMADETHLTQTGAIVGTPAYMAPEQAAGRDIDHRCDLFSLGCVLYRLCTDELPFKGKDTIAIVSALALETPKPPHEMAPGVPVPLSNFVMRLLAKKPEDRPQSAQEVAAELAELADHNTAIPSAPTKTRRAPGSGEQTQTVLAPSGRRWLWPAATGALVFFSLVPILWLALGGRTAPTGQNNAGSVAGETKSPDTLPPTFTNSLGMEFVLVPKGKSWLGGGGGQPGDKEVEIKEDFYLGKYEVTQEEWEKVMGSNPSYFSRTGTGKDVVKDIPDAVLKRFPVETMSWGDAQVFLGLLNKQDKQEGWVYRLPKEAEWEYACRGGPGLNRADYGFDFYLETPTNSLPKDMANFKETGLNRTCKVGSFHPNRLGLYDMHGNVWEWCDDLETEGSTSRARRGGAWGLDAPFCRPMIRFADPPTNRHEAHGLRLARVPVDKVNVVPPPKPPEQVKPVGALPPAFTNSLGMEFVLVPKGKSWLGGGGGKPGDREVEIKEDFYLGKYEVTQQEWEKVMGPGTNPSSFSRTGKPFPPFGGGSEAVKNIPEEELKRFPVENLSWEDAQLFFKALNAKAKEAGWVYRLPTEVEWEYACRGGPMNDKLGSAFDFYFDKPLAQLQPE